MLVKRNPIFSTVFDELLNDLAIKTNDDFRFKTPAANIVENETNFVLSLAAPGMNKKDFTIDLDGEILTVSAEVKSENEENKPRFTLKEYNFKTFKRTFTLPKDLVQAENISASYKDGELNITIPKVELVVQKPKMIEVK
ncbi:Hsp20/alpha crystallin family protein [Namhaeicola litoreus]|uniref:Hsp20/alpha crystallin family protein n=1 Tax=Namhaeicola litoreus TaxID=1052145 RepID=A0ABW3Y421_9FLAO